MNEMPIVTGILSPGDIRGALSFLKPREVCLEEKGAGKRGSLAPLLLAGHLFGWQASQTAPVLGLPGERELEKYGGTKQRKELAMKPVVLTVAGVARMDEVLKWTRDGLVPS